MQERHGGWHTFVSTVRQVPSCLLQAPGANVMHPSLILSHEGLRKGRCLCFVVNVFWYI
jgi:hypothetical protein